MIALILSASAVTAAAAPTPSIVAELTIYSDGTAIGDAGSAGLLDGHSFISVKNISQSNITVGKFTDVHPAELLTLGTFGNKAEHSGLWYNLEAHFTHQNASAYATASLSRQLTSADLRTLNSYIVNHDSYNVVTNNCSSFASGAWNSVAPFASELYAGIPNTPTGLYYNITQVGGYVDGASVNIPWTSRGVWYAQGKSKYPVRSTEFPERAPSGPCLKLFVGLPS